MLSDELFQANDSYELFLKSLDILFSYIVQPSILLKRQIIILDFF